MEKKHIPIKDYQLVNEVKNKHNVVIISHIPQGNLCRTRRQKNMKVLKNIDKNEIYFVFGIHLHMMKQL